MPYGSAIQTINYPNDILSDHFENRSIKMIIKKINWNNSKTQLLKRVQDAWDSVKELLREDPSTITKENFEEKWEEALEYQNTVLESEVIAGFGLPLPNELSDSQTHDFSTEKNIIGQLLGQLTDKSIAGVGVNQIIGNLSNTTGVRKPIVNPGYFQDYNGSQPRSFSFSWDLIPNNKEDADNIKIILYNLKKFTLPQAVGGVGLFAPYSFQIEIGNQTINAIMRMANVVCTQMDIQYGAEGALQFFKDDDMPKYIKLDMTFAEKSFQTSNLYK